MSSKPHDALSKQVYSFLLDERFGRIETEVEVPGESLFVDVVFVPDPNPSGDRQLLGLLGRAIARPCLLETYRQAPTRQATNVCLLKRTWYGLELARQARRADRKFRDGASRPLRERDEPQLWIVTPTASRRYLKAFGATQKADWPKGVYELPNGQHAGIIAIHQLPPVPETLWFRLLGRGRVQARAAQEVLELPNDHPLRAGALKLLASWKIVESIHPELIDEERELRMILSQAYAEWEEKLTQKVEQRAKQEGKQEVALNLLRMGMTVEQVSAATGLAREQIQQLQGDRSS